MGDLEEELNRGAAKPAWRARAWYWLRALPLAARFLSTQCRHPAAASRAAEGIGHAFIRDGRFAWRSLVRRPSFLVVAGSTLALGIGVTTAIFSVVNAVLLNPLPYPETDRIAVLWQRNLSRGEDRDLVAPGNFIDWERRSERTFEHLAAISPWGLDYIGDGDPESVPALLVGEGYFPTLGARMHLGRALQREDFTPSGATGGFGSTSALVFTYEFWVRRFGSDSSVIGRRVFFSDRPYTIVGVLSPDFRSPVYSGRDVYGPLVFWPGAAEDRKSAFLGVIGRRRAGVSLDQAVASLRVLGRQLAAEHPQDNAATEIAYVPVLEQMVGRVRPILYVLLGAVASILLIACANIANLLLARSSERRGEFAVRLALGASQPRLVRQMLTESLMLAALGSLTGLVLSRWIVRLVVALAPSNVPRLNEATLNLPVGLFTAGVTLATAILIGLVPAWSASRASLSGTLRESGAKSSPGGAHNRTRGTLTIAQVALAMSLTLSAGLLVRSLDRMLTKEPGFNPTNVATLQVYAYTRFPTAESRVLFFSQASDKLRGLPGVVGAAVAQAPPLVPGGGDIALPVSLPGQEARGSDGDLTAWSNVVGPRYFQTLGIPIKSGRAIDETDNANSARVAVINETMARRYWRGENAIGRQFTVVTAAGPTTMEVVGIAGDVQQAGLDDQPRPYFYPPHAQSPNGGMVFVVRTRASAASQMDAIKRAIWSVNASQPFYAVATMDELISRSVAQRRFAMVLLGIFAALAGLLAAVGTYGVVSNLAMQRRQEIGIRMALGARPAQILWSVTRQGVAWIVAGIAAGVVLAIATAGVMRTLLFETSASDPVTIMGSISLLFAVGIAATWVAARRATRADPMKSLRGD